MARCCEDPEAPSRRPARFHVFSISDSISIEETSPPTPSPYEWIHVSTLLLPSFKSSYHCTDIYKFASSSSPNTSLGLLFVTLGYTTPYDRNYFHVVSSVGSLMKYGTRQSQEGRLGGRMVPWQDWGPDSSRIFVQDMEPVDPDLSG